MKNLHNIESHKNSFEYDNLVIKLIQLCDAFESYHQNLEKFPLRWKEVQKIVNDSELAMKELVKNFCNFDRMEEFFKFVYELRKQDQSDKYTEYLIKEHIKVPVLFELIMANNFKDVMEFDDSKF